MAHETLPRRAGAPLRPRGTHPRPAPVHRPDRRQHHRRRDLQPALRAAVVRPDQPGRDGAGHGRRLALALHVRRAVAPACPADGGPYAYARAGLRQRDRLQPTRGRTGSRRGRATRRSSWAGCSTSSGSSTRAARTVWSIVIALVGLWIPAAGQPDRRPEHGRVPGLDHVLKFIPLVLMATVGLFFINGGQLHAVEHQRRHQPVGDRRRDGDLPVQLPRRRDRRRRCRQGPRTPSGTCRRSTIYGTLASAVVYMLSLVAVFGILPTSELAQADNQASYSAAADSIARRHLGRRPRRASP